MVVTGLLFWIACWLGLFGAEAAPTENPALAEMSTSRCLVRAGVALGSHRRELDELHASLHEDRPASLRGSSTAARGALMSHGLPTDLFTRFDGAWQGDFGDLPVRHLWVSLDEVTQLVVIDDGGVRREGINLVDEEGTICGLVTGAGPPRLHVGRWRPDAEHLEWTTEHRRYEERVLGPAYAPRYQIVERDVDGGEALTHAEYRRPSAGPCPYATGPLG